MEFSVGIVSNEDKSYPINISSEPISELKNELEKIIFNRNYLIVINQKVYRLYKKQLKLDKKHIFVMPDGEKYKNFETYKKILAKAFQLKLTRKDLIIAIGGGVVGDITGFVASTYMRGIDYIQIPTTLLACVDSAVGGKVAIDNEFGKNLVGSFWQPKKVLINLNFLNTLDKKQFKTGMAEVIKYAFIENNVQEDSQFMEFLTINSDRIIKRDLNMLEKIITVCLKIKIAVVSQDEKENGLRKILNFGHTYAHALEYLTKYKKYTHGEAVGFGMVYIFDYAFSKGLIGQTYKNLALDLLDKYGFPLELPKMNQEKILQAMQLDKKNKTDSITLIIPTKKGYVEESILEK